MLLVDEREFSRKGTAMSTTSFLAKMIDLLYPPNCVCCGELSESRSYLCNRCIEELPWYRKERTDFDYLPVPEFDRCVAVFTYEGRIPETIQRLKTKNDKRVIRFFVRQLETLVKNTFPTELEIPRIITFVPMSEAQERQRGYNHAQEVSRMLGRLLNRPVASDLLMERDNARTQHLLDVNERFLNAQESIVIGQRRDLTGFSILLIDDIVTSGATLNRCASLLKEMGAQSVTCAAIVTTTHSKHKAEE